jgi:hypothetical protein
MSLGEIIKSTPQIATPRVYLMYCSCEIENYSHRIIDKMINSHCSYMYEFFRNKQLLGELNFKWKNNCFDKFLKLFGTEFYADMIEKILEDDVINDDKGLLDNSFETIRANRGLVAHENSNLNITVNEIDSSFQVCKKAFEIVLESLDI